MGFKQRPIQRAYRRSIGLPALLALALLGTPHAARAATFTVTSAADSGTGSLRNAIANANATVGADTITFDPSAFATAQTVTLTSGQLIVSDDLTLQGPGAGLLTVNGNNTFRVFEITAGTAQISGLTVTGGNGSSGGGGGGGDVASFAAPPAVTGVGNGGGIFVDADATLALTDCTVTGNAADSEGGGVYNNGALALMNCTLTDNAATSDGGGVYSVGTSLTFTGCTLTNNAATDGEGGGVYNNGALALMNCTLTDNAATSDGGAVDSEVGLTLTGCTLTGNSVIGGEGDGGAVNSDGGTSAFTDCTFTGNTATNSGGAIVLEDNNTLTLVRCAFVGNAAAASGGAIFTEDGGETLALTDCIVSGNTANGASDLNTGTLAGGGGLYNLGALTLTRCTLDGNHATGAGAFGGGLANLAPSGASTATLTNCTLTGNSADTGGGVFNMGVPAIAGGGSGNPSLATATLTDCTVTGNSATTSGGGLSAGPGVFNVQATIVAGNTAPAGGGPDVSVTAFAVFTSGGSNLIGADDAQTTDGFADGVNHDQVGTTAAPIDARLGPLQDNGGPTATVALLPGSPAIDADFSAAPPATDQRGVTRSEGLRADIGAYELSDFTPPVTTASLSGVSYANGFWRGGPVTVTLNATDDFSGVAATYFSVDSGPRQTYTGPFTVSGDFAHLVAFYSVDGAGNTEGPAKTVTFSIDTTPPTTEITSRAVSGGQEVTLKATDNFSGVATTFYRVDSGPLQTYSSSFVVTGAGQHLVTAYSIDRALNAENPNKSLVFTVGPTADTTAPVTTPALSGVSYVNGFYRGPVTVTLTATDNASGVSATFYSVDSGPRRTYAGPFSVPGDFAHLVAFYSVDGVGNAEGPAKTVTFSIDSTPPNTTLTSRAVSGGQEVTLKATDNFSGVATTFYRVDAGPLHAYTAPFVVTGNFTHLVTAYSIDRATNTEGPAKSLSFTLAPPTPDTTAPVTTPALSAASYANGYYRGPVTVKLTATDDDSGVAATYFSVDSGPRQTYTGPFTVSGDFAHLVAFYSTDHAGNAEGPAKSVTFSIDTTPPTTAISSLFVRRGRQVTLTATDNFSGVLATLYRVDGGSLQIYSGPFFVSGTGHHQVTAYSVDRAFNGEVPIKSITFSNP